MARSLYRPLVLAFSGGVAAVAALAGASLYVEERYADHIVRVAQAPLAPVGIVFGAGLESSTEPSPILAERLQTAAALFGAQRIGMILVSGDSSDRHHDEAGVMRRWLVDHGVPADRIIEDPAGISTYETCERALSIYQVKQAVLITQEFHLPRALFIARALGMDAWGVAADEGRSGWSFYELRELWLRPRALALVLFHPKKG